MKAFRSWRARGFTMMELMAAVAIFGTAVVGTASVIYHGNRASAAAHAHQIASLAAQSAIEDLRASPFSSIQECSDRPLRVAALSLHEVPTLSLLLTVEDSGEPGGVLKEVRVQALWGSRRRRRSLELSTLIGSHRSNDEGVSAIDG